VNLSFLYLKVVVYTYIEMAQRVILYIDNYKQNVVVLNKVLEYQKTKDPSVFFDLNRNSFKDIKEEIRYFTCPCREGRIRLCAVKSHVETTAHLKYVKKQEIRKRWASRITSHKQLL